ncbi:MAG: MerR family transcriptional regulator [Dissulfurimicrobium sp.]
MDSLLGCAVRRIDEAAATPIYSIGVAAYLLDMHPKTLQMLETEGLVYPKYNGFLRLFSQADIYWLRCLTAIIYEIGVTLPSLKRLLQHTTCWKILNCKTETRMSRKVIMGDNPAICYTESPGHPHDILVDCAIISKISMN